MQSTATIIEHLLRDQSGYAGPMAYDTSLGDVLGLDSLDRIEIVMLIEEEFDIEIPDSDFDVETLGTFGGLTAYVEGRL